MENKRQYQKELDSIIEEIKTKGEKPRLLLHSCCAPCSSYVLTYLYPYFDIYVLYYNPNITEENEFNYRYEELKRMVSEMGLQIHFIERPYDNKEFFEAVKGLEKEKEGGKRCHVCFSLRLRIAAEEAKAMNADYFCTTLTISPLKDAERLNTIGESLSNEFGIAWLPSDFKKKGGYQTSIKLSREYSLYRQDYCGCIFSKMERQGCFPMV